MILKRSILYHLWRLTFWMFGEQPPQQTVAYLFWPRIVFWPVYLAVALLYWALIAYPFLFFVLFGRLLSLPRGSELDPQTVALLVGLIPYIAGTLIMWGNLEFGSERGKIHARRWLWYERLMVFLARRYKEFFPREIEFNQERS